MSRNPVSPVILAAIWMSGTLSSLLMLAIAARELANAIPVVQMINVRNAVSFLLICLALQAKGWHQLHTTRFSQHLVRNVSHMIAQYAWFVALAAIPITEVFALEFTGPVWTVLIAAMLVGEKINRFRVLTLVLGLVGVLIILRPGFRDPDPAHFLVIFSALCFSLANVMTKKLVPFDSPLCIIFYMTVIQFLLTLVPTWSGWVSPDAREWGWLCLMGLVSITAHFCFARAFAHADAMVVIPMDFLRLPLAGVVGWLLYAEGLDPFVVAGAVIMFTGNFINIAAEKSRREAEAEI